MKRQTLTAGLAALMLGTATGAYAQGATHDHSDPWEGFNRFSFKIFMGLDRAIIAPVARAYLKVVPKPVQTAIHNVIANLGEPVVGINDVLQGHFHKATVTTVRFVTNSTFGVGGLIDMATPAGVPHHDNGFDITLGRLHIGSGPYVFLPLIGPSTVRDLIGSSVDSAMDPFHWANYPHRAAFGVARTLVGAVDTRARNDANLTSLLSDATDPYATLRSVYLQNEQSKIDEGTPAAQQPLPDFDDGTPATPPATDGAKPAPDAAAPVAAAADAPGAAPPPDAAAASSPAAPAPADPAPAAAASADTAAQPASPPAAAPPADRAKPPTI